MDWLHTLPRLCVGCCRKQPSDWSKRMRYGYMRVGNAVSFFLSFLFLFSRSSLFLTNGLCEHFAAGTGNHKWPAGQRRIPLMLSLISFAEISTEMGHEGQHSCLVSSCTHSHFLLGSVLFCFIFLPRDLFYCTFAESSRNVRGCLSFTRRQEQSVSLMNRSKTHGKRYIYHSAKACALDLRSAAR